MNATARPHNPIIFDLGALPLVLPDEHEPLAPILGDLGAAVVLQDLGFGPPAQLIVAGVERRLGVNDAHRKAAATSQAEVLASIREAKRRAKLERSAEAARAGMPKRDQDIADALAAGQRRRLALLAEIEALQEEGGRKHRQRLKALKSQASQIAKQMDELRKAKADHDAVLGDSRETIMLARERGEDVEAEVVETAEVVTDEHGARVIHRTGPNRGLPSLRYSRGSRIRKLTGIKHAYAKGHLDSASGRQADALLEIGELYGAAFDIHEGRVSSSGEGGGGFGPKGPQIRQVEAGELLAIMREPLTPRELRVLDLVCGLGQRPREAATTMGAGFPSTIRALRSGLQAARTALGEARERREVGGHRKRLRGVPADLTRLAKD